MMMAFLAGFLVGFFGQGILLRRYGIVLPPCAWVWQLSAKR